MAGTKVGHAPRIGHTPSPDGVMSLLHYYNRAICVTKTVVSIPKYKCLHSPMGECDKGVPLDCPFH